MAPFDRSQFLLVCYCKYRTILYHFRFIWRWICELFIRRASTPSCLSDSLARSLWNTSKTMTVLPDLQSAYRAMHSTETAVLKILADTLLALDSGDLAMLTLLDLSAAFDSVDHDTRLNRLQKSYGLGGQMLNWFASYLCGRVQHVRTSAACSTPSAVLYGVPQGSVLGPILFLLYTAILLQLVKRHQLIPHDWRNEITANKGDTAVLFQQYTFTIHVLFT